MVTLHVQRAHIAASVHGTYRNTSSMTAEGRSMPARLRKGYTRSVATPKKCRRIGRGATNRATRTGAWNSPICEGPS